LASFKYNVLDSMDELLEVYNQAPEAYLIAGGSDLMVTIHNKVIEPGLLIDITGVKEMSVIEEKDDYVSIGPCCTHRDIGLSELLNKQFPYIVEASKSVGAEQTRSVGTIGGNICSAVPSTDLAPSLMVSGARLVLSSVDGERTVNIENFFTGPRRTVLQDNEVLTEIQMPKRDDRIGKFIKFGRRKALSLALVNVAVAVCFDSEYKEIEDTSIALGAVAPTPVRASQAEEFLKTNTLSESNIEKAVEMVPEAASPISDIRASAEYRLDLIKALSRRALNNIMEEAGRSRK